MSRAARLVIGGAVLVGIAYYANWFLANYEEVEYDRWVGLRGEARRNPLLAAERFIAASGGRAQGVEILPFAGQLGAGDALLLSAGIPDLSDAQADALLDWVRGGGTLVLPAWPSADREFSAARGPDRLLAAVEVRLRTAEDDEEDEPLPTTVEPSDAEEGDATAVPGGDAAADAELADDELDDEPVRSGRIRARWGRDGPPLRLSLSPYRLLAGPESGYEAVLREGDAAYAYGFRHGAGRIVVLGDGGIFLNDEIGLLDHAAFLWRLVGGVQGTVWLAYRVEMPPLWRYLWDRARPLSVTALLLLLAWLLWVSRRVGPLLPPEDTARRSLAEHLDASGRFAWRSHLRAELVEAVRRSFRRRAEGVRPGLGALPLAEQAHWLAEHTPVPEAAIRAALAPGTPPNAHAFVHVVATLQQLRKSL